MPTKSKVRSYVENLDVEVVTKAASLAEKIDLGRKIRKEPTYLAVLYEEFAKSPWNANPEKFSVFIAEIMRRAFRIATGDDDGFHPEVQDEEFFYPEPNTSIDPWVGYDLDGTLAEYSSWVGPWHIGKPIKPMIDRLKKDLKAGHIVKIITARVGNQPPAYVRYVIAKIHEWLEAQGLPKLEVVSTKDYGMVRMYDDRCIAVEPNTGKILAGRV